MINKLFKLAARPVGMAKRSDFTYEEVPVREPAEGELLVKVHYISLDPAMRGWMNPGKSYIRPVEIGEIMRAGTIGEVVASRHPQFHVGDYVSGTQGVQSYAISDGRGLVKVDPRLAPLPKYLNVLGMPGMTAYFGLLEVGQPKPGETVVVSAAAGAVGQIVGQIAKIKGCKAVGIAGGAEKCRYLTEQLGVERAIDYRSEDVAAALAQVEGGINAYFDNVGGPILDAVLPNMAHYGRVAICGLVSAYDNDRASPGPAQFEQVLMRRLRIEGFFIPDFLHRGAEFLPQLRAWHDAGKLTVRFDEGEGLDNVLSAYAHMLSGGNIGKVLVKLFD